MNEQELKKLWDKLQGKLNVGTFESFKSKMSTPEKRQRFWDKFYQKLKDEHNFNLGNLNDFLSRLDGNQNNPPTSSPTTVPTQSGDKGQVSTKKTNTVGGTNTIGTTKKSKYTKCSEQLPIKQYCKNETIRKVQACLKMPKRYQTGNFGPITQEYLESRNQNGTLITTETIINICGANHPLVPGVPYSSVPKTGYEDYTVDEIEYSNDVQNTKPSTPSSEKPEGEGTGYEDYSEEKPQPASPSTPKSASSFSSEIPGLQSSKKSFTNRTMDSDEIEY